MVEAAGGEAEKARRRQLRLVRPLLYELRGKMQHVDLEDLVDTAGGACEYEVAPSPLKARSTRFTGEPGRTRSDFGGWAARATARSDLRAAGWRTEDFAKPMVTVAFPWTNVVPCNNHLRELGDAVVHSLEQRAAKAVMAAAPVIGDGMTNGEEHDIICAES